MGYLSENELKNLGFKKYGKNILISNKASIYNPELIEIGNNVRIDDFCLLSGKIKISSYIHITPYVLLAGGTEGIIIKDYCTFAYGVKVFSQTDDYSGGSMVNSLIPKKYKMETKKKITINKHCIFGANSIIFPGINVAEGTSLGAGAILKQNTEPWSIYVGIPAYKKKQKSKTILELEKKFNNDTI